MSDALIVAVGARTPVGLRADTSAAAVRAGVSRVTEHPFMVDRAGDAIRVAFDATLGEELFGTERMVELARSALREVCQHASWRDRPRVDLFLGLPEPRPGFEAADVDAVLRALSDDLPFELGAVLPYPRGHAAALLALQDAVASLESGRSDWCLVGGVDSYLQADTLDWLDDARQLKSERNRSGFFAGEGAGFVLLTGRAQADAEQLRVLAEVLSVASAVEPNRIKTKTICVGVGLSRAIKDATRCLDAKTQKISRSYCDINGERYRSDEFMYVPLRVWQPFVDANTYEAPAGSWGDVGAASGALFAVLAVASRERGYAPGEYALLWASSEAGERCAATLALPQPQGRA